MKLFDIKQVEIRAEELIEESNSIEQRKKELIANLNNYANLKALSLLLIRSEIPLLRIILAEIESLEEHKTRIDNVILRKPYLVPFKEFLDSALALKEIVESLLKRSRRDSKFLIATLSRIENLRHLTFRKRYSRWDRRTEREIAEAKRRLTREYQIEERLRQQTDPIINRYFEMQRQGILPPIGDPELRRIRTYANQNNTLARLVFFFLITFVSSTSVQRLYTENPPEQEPIQKEPQITGMKGYTIKKGDTIENIWKLMNYSNINWDYFIWAVTVRFNSHIKDWGNIPEGTKIAIPVEKEEPVKTEDALEKEEPEETKGTIIVTDENHTERIADSIDISQLSTNGILKVKKEKGVVLTIYYHNKSKSRYTNPYIPIAAKGDYTFYVSRNDKVSPNFRIREFACHCGCSTFRLDLRLVVKLEKLRTNASDRGIMINSGYRCPTHNRRVGGSKKSQHMYGTAADINIEGLSPKQMKDLAEGVGFGGIGTYNGKNMIHVDVRENRTRWRH